MNNYLLEGEKSQVTLYAAFETKDPSGLHKGKSQLQQVSFFIYLRKQLSVLRNGSVLYPFYFESESRRIRKSIALARLCMIKTMF